MTTPSASSVTRQGVAVAAVAYASVIVSHMFGRFTYSVLLPAISDDLVSSYSAAGFLGASYFGGYLLGVIAVTVMSSRIEPIVLLRTGLGLSFMALATVATAPRFSVLSSGIFFTGLAGAGIWIPAPTIATSRLPDRHRGLVLGGLTASMGVGLLAISQGTTAYRSLVDDDGIWREIFAIETGLAVLVLVAALVLVRGQVGGVGSSAEPAPGGSMLFDLRGLRSIPQWHLLLGAYASFGVLAGTWTQFFGVALEADAGYSRAHINNLFSLFAVATIFGALGFGRLSDRIGRDRTIALACAITAISSVLVPLGHHLSSAVAAVLFGAGSFAVPPTVAAGVRDHLEGRKFAQAFGAMTIVFATMSMVSAQLAGWLADQRGSFDLVYVLLGVAAVHATVFARLRARLTQTQSNINFG